MTVVDLAGPEYEALRATLHREYGMDITTMDGTIVAGKIRGYYKRHGLSSLAECMRFIEGDEQRLREIGDFIYSQHTSFNRGPSQFQFVVDTVLEAQRLNGGRIPQPVVVWCVGCSTGQEAYTAVIYLLDRVFGESASPAGFRVLGSDCSVAAIRTANEGVYPIGDARQLEPIPYERYFVAAGDGRLSVGPKVRSHVSFSYFNVTSSHYDSEARYDFVFLRNLLDFHTEENRYTVLSNLRRTIKSRGHLILEEEPPRRRLLRECGYETVAAGCHRIVDR